MEFSRFESDILYLYGEWTLDNILAIKKQLSKQRYKILEINATGLEKLDTSGCWIILKLSNKNNAAVNNLKPKYQTIFYSIAQYKPPVCIPVDKDPLFDLLVKIGINALSIWQQLISLIHFIGQTAEHLVVSILAPRKIRIGYVCKYIYETGITAIPIIALMAFLISIVLAYQGATQLSKFGAEIFTVDLVALSILREMAVLLTAIMVAGRSGSAFTAEIGVMKVNEEVDALQTMGVDPFEILVMPRLMAMVISLPLLTFIADITGLFGAFIISSTLLDIPANQFILRLEETVTLTHFFAGMIKAPVFAFLIAGISCLRGMQIQNSAEEVGRYTTIAVVESIFSVILADAVFSIIYSELGI